MEQSDRLATALAALAERLRHGRVTELAPLVAELDRALAAVEQAPPSAGTLAVLRAQAHDTAQLLDGALRGVAAARRRMSEIEAVRQGQGTYGDDGRRQTLLGPRGNNYRA